MIKLLLIVSLSSVFLIACGSADSDEVKAVNTEVTTKGVKKNCHPYGKRWRKTLV